MHSLKKSLSFCRNHAKSSEDQCPKGGHPNTNQTKSSLDTFLIPGRTRYPSDQTESSAPTSVDLKIGTMLLDQICTDEGTACNSEQQDGTTSYTESCLCLYNHAARRYGLSVLTTSPINREPTKPTNDDVKHNTWSWIQHRLSRKSSLMSIPVRHPPSPSTFHSLDDICRLGGVSKLHFSQQYPFSSLTLPTCIAATANYLIEHGKGVAGIFRIPGQTSIVNALYGYYVLRLKCEDELPDNVQTTISSLDLPQAFNASAHDVASTFKKFLWDVPGGIVGSLTLFKALKQIESLAPPQDQAPHMNHQILKARLTALALLSLCPRHRFDLILAVFTLLTILKQDEDLHIPTSTSSLDGAQECMSSKALAVVFAPVLLGNLSDEIEVDNSHSASKKNLLPHRKMPKRNIKTDCSPEIIASLGRTSFATNVIEFLLSNWDEIVKHLFILKELNFPSTSRLYGLPRSSSQPTMGGASFTGPNHSLPWAASHAKLVMNNAICKAPLSSHNIGAFDGTKSSGSLAVSLSSSSAGKNALQANHLQHGGQFRIARSSDDIEATLPWWERFTKTTSNASVIVTKRSITHGLGKASSSSSDWKYRAVSINTQSSSTDSAEQDVRHKQGTLNPSVEESRADCEEDDLQSKQIESSDNLGNSRTGVLSGSLQDPEVADTNDKDFPPKVMETVNTEVTDGQQWLLNECQSLKFGPLRIESSSPQRLKKVSSLIPKPVGYNSSNYKKQEPTGQLKNPSDDIVKPNLPGSKTSLNGAEYWHSELASLTQSTVELNVPVSQRAARLNTQKPTLSALPLRPEGTVARHLNFRTSSEEESRDFGEDFHLDLVTSNNIKLGTLFAEVRRQKLELDARREEVTHLRHELDVMRRCKDAGTLSEKLRETEREVRFWKHRAEWAEKILFGKGGSDAI